ncbi:unnamed protein product [Menidia menidia]|uniref:Acyltransferase n=1 Tax=Menidia menidia TaxID=238744 RepID=A0A8S4AVZ1_9TELE|nr:unnamed protein product [Menidia menidia]
MTQEKSQFKKFLEELSVLQWVLSFLFLGVSCVVLLVYLMFTSLWPLSVLYFTWLVVDWKSPERGGRKNRFVKKWRVWEHMRDFFPVKLIKTAELNPNKNYVLGCHPHGILAVGAFSCFSTEGCGFEKAFPGVKSTLAVLAGLLKVPILRDYLMFAGICPVSKPSLVHLLSKSGKGNAVSIVVGGAAESLASSPGVNTVLMKQRKGFIRIALEFGADLVPVYIFGENDLFHQLIFSEGSLGRRLQDMFKKITGFAPCLFIGEQFVFIPKRTPVTTVVGKPIPVPPPFIPTEEDVDHYHRLYMEALTKLFHEHKVSCGLPESHKLQII